MSLLKPEHERISSLLISTVTMLCKNGIQFSSDLKIQGVIGITVDSDRVFLIELKKWIDVAGNNLLHAESDSMPASVGRSAAAGYGIKAEPYAAGFPTASQFSNFGTGDHFENNAGGFGEDGYNDDDEQTEIADNDQPTNTIVEYHEEINYTFPKIKNEPNASTSVGNQQLHSSPGWNRPTNTTNQFAPNSSPVRGLPRIRRGQPPRGGVSLRGQRGRGGGARGRPVPTPGKRGAPQVSSPRTTPSKMPAQDGSGFTFGKIVQTSYVCNLCGAQLSSHASLLTHQVRIHGRQKKANMGRKPKQPQQYAE